jgi:acyl-CoA synthetase (AMP-forming)/AMP-acid ligase II
MPTRNEIVAELTGPSGEFPLEPFELNGVPMRVYKNAPASLRDLFLSTKAFGHRPFLIYNSEVLTFDDHFRQVAALAAHLRSIGVEEGDRVAIGMRNYPEWVTSFWACQAIGAVVVALNAWWTGPELEYGLEDSGSKVLIADWERLERIEDRLQKLGIAETIVVRGLASSKARAFADVVATRAELPAASISPEDFSTILYTSGTTGRPKGAAATQRNHITNIMNAFLGAAVGRKIAGAPPPPPEFQAGALQTFPFFHIGGLTGLYMATVTGTKLALMYRWDPAAAVALVSKHGLNGVSGVPYVVRQLLDSARSAGQALPSLVGVASGGAPVPPDLIRTVGTQFQARVAPANGYGLTETTSAVITNGGAEYLARPDSVGRPVPTTDAKVVDDNGRECGDGEIGEIWIRGPQVIPGYWRNQKATDEAFGGGWFRSGDLGFRDEDGCYHVVDRKKDMIIRGGENVYCVEVETALLEHSLVRDVAVLGLPHPELGEIVACVIQPKSHASDVPKAEAELREFLEGHLAKFKLPARYAFTDEDLPRTATGKLLKREMRTKYFSM